jgi:hypothetical protein
MFTRKCFPHRCDSLSNVRCRYLPEDIADIAKSASIIFTFRSEQSVHCKIAAVIGCSKCAFSVVINDRKHLVKFAPLILEELNVDVLFENGRHYDVQINISLPAPSQSVSIFLQSSAASFENLEQSCFACKSKSSLQPMDLKVHLPPAIYTSSFDCSVQFSSKNDHFQTSSL